MENPPPIIVFFTSKQCGHCLSFRGQDGKPKQGHPWNYDSIRNYLNKYTKDGIIPRSTLIIEIHKDKSLPSSLSDVSEINIYMSIPSESEIIELSKQKTIESPRYFEENDVCGTSVQRINIKRGFHNRIEIKTEINESGRTKNSHLMKDYNFHEFVWKNAPIEVEVHRICVKRNKDLPNGILDDIKDPNLRNHLIEGYATFGKNSAKFDRYLLDNYFDYDWLVSRIIPHSLKMYEIHYPCWMLISPIEWGESVSNPERQIYARVKNHVTRKIRGRFIPQCFSQSETIEYLLDEYMNGDLKLEYDPSQTNSKKLYSWQL